MGVLNSIFSLCNNKEKERVNPSEKQTTENVLQMPTNVTSNPQHNTSQTSYTQNKSKYGVYIGDI